MRIYNLIFKIIFPLIFLRSIYKSLRFGDNLSRILEKFSFYKGEKGSKAIIHIHAVSVGEVLASRKFIEEIQKRMSGWQLESFKESYAHKTKHGISLLKKKIINETK